MTSFAIDCGRNFVPPRRMCLRRFDPYHPIGERTNGPNRAPARARTGVAAGAGLGPGTEGMRREAVIDWTGVVRRQLTFRQDGGRPWYRRAALDSKARRLRCNPASTPIAVVALKHRAQVQSSRDIEPIDMDDRDDDHGEIPLVSRRRRPTAPTASLSGLKCRSASNSGAEAPAP